MTDIMTPAQALASRSGMVLDVFVFRYIFDGIIEGKSQIPSFSRRADAAKMLLIKMIMESEGAEFGICYGDHWERAKQLGQVVNDVRIPMWRARIAGDEGFGKTLEEAIAKLAIVRHGKPNA